MRALHSFRLTYKCSRCGEKITKIEISDAYCALDLFQRIIRGAPIRLEDKVVPGLCVFGTREKTVREGVVVAAQLAGRCSKDERPIGYEHKISRVANLVTVERIEE